MLAQKYGLWLSLGGYQEAGGPENRVYNTHVVVDGQGEIKSTYRKIHLFDVDVPNGPVLLESKYTAPGEA
jgi:predicted amidohydrolase